jgi:riboflavin synthase
MFSGIVEAMGRVESISSESGNVDFWISSPFTHELKIDQSVAHNGACLTVVEIKESQYRVTAIAETLNRTNLGSLVVGDNVNLERCIRMNDRLDGHMVQGHVDCIGTCISKKETNGSWEFFFKYLGENTMTTVSKGSICINGVSLTVVDSELHQFSVCIIPYTYENTNFRNLKVGLSVNLEFDIIGKYVMKYMSFQNK